MKDVDGIREDHGDLLIDTGSPHYIKFVSDVRDYDVYRKGMDIRYSSEFAEKGVNVNFVEQEKDNSLFVRTYERGVEDETLSCGTGVTAAALASAPNKKGFNDVTVQTKGGKLSVEFEKIDEHTYRDIWLCGPAEKVFVGEIVLSS